MRNPLFPPEPKNRTYGFIVVDRANKDAPLRLSENGLFVPSKDASFFRILPRAHRETSRTSARTLDYVFCRNRVEKIIARHYRILDRLHSSSMTRDWERTKTAASVKPKIKSVKTNPS